MTTTSLDIIIQDEIYFIVEIPSFTQSITRRIMQQGMCYIAYDFLDTWDAL